MLPCSINLIHINYPRKNMKKYFIILLFSLTTLFTVMPTMQSHAIIWKVVTEAAKKVLRAIDLQIQRQQNKVIWLQNAQKTLENTMSKLKLKEISEWTDKQRKLYDDYFQELWRVKNTLSTYHKVREIINRQVQLVQEYNQAWNLLRQDKHFSAGELQDMYRVYSGILEESLKNIDQLFLVTNSFATQMSDGKRLELIQTTADELETNVTDLRSFNERNFRISHGRARDAQEADYLKKLYGL